MTPALRRCLGVGVQTQLDGALLRFEYQYADLDKLNNSFNFDEDNNEYSSTHAQHRLDSLMLLTRRMRHLRCLMRSRILHRSLDGVVPCVIASSATPV